jgi:hypothetical protein
MLDNVVHSGRFGKLYKPKWNKEQKNKQKKNEYNCVRNECAIICTNLYGGVEVYRK